MIRRKMSVDITDKIFGLKLLETGQSLFSKNIRKIIKDGDYSFKISNNIPTMTMDFRNQICPIMYMKSLTWYFLRLRIRFSILDYENAQKFYYHGNDKTLSSLTTDTPTGRKTPLKWSFTTPCTETNSPKPSTECPTSPMKNTKRSTCLD